MKKLSSVLALAALLGFGSSVFAEEDKTSAPSTADTKNAPATAAAPTPEEDKSSENKAKDKDANKDANKDESSDD